MNSGGPFHPQRQDLPAVLPVFPLSGALLLPGGRLPLNIFEPRYLALVQDSLGLGRMMGMIQPAEPEAPPGQPQRKLFSVGCLGRITSFAETSDGRFLITLTGVIRFHAGEELPMQRGYRRLVPDYGAYGADLAPAPQAPELFRDRRRLLPALSGFLAAADLPLNLGALEGLPDDQVVNTLSMICPLEAPEKQALLEAFSLQDRADMLLTILELASYGGSGLQ